MSCIQHCSIISNSFALKIPCVLPIPAPTFSNPDTYFYCLIYIDIIPITHLKTLTKLPSSWDTAPPLQVSGLSNGIPGVPLLGIYTEIMLLFLNSPSLRIKVSHLPDDLCLTLFSEQCHSITDRGGNWEALAFGHVPESEMCKPLQWRPLVFWVLWGTELIYCLLPSFLSFQVSARKKIFGFQA